MENSFSIATSTIVIKPYELNRSEIKSRNAEKGLENSPFKLKSAKTVGPQMT